MSPPTLSPSGAGIPPASYSSSASTEPRHPASIRLLLALAAIPVLLSACSSHRPAPPSPGVVSSGSAAPFTVIAADWSFGDIPGRRYDTPGYRIFTTEGDPLIIARLPSYLELALREYRTSLTAAPLPAPSARLDVYVMADRAQWARLTTQLLGPSSPRYLAIPRGGYAWGGKAVYFDLGGGAQATFAIAGHEGWHQYVQRSFADPLPIWLDEGIATLFEGHRWRGATPHFLPWANLERYDQLRAAVAAEAILSLETLLELSPRELIAGDATTTLNYYAQVWALAHFLREGAAGKYAAGFERLLADASIGRMSRNVSQRFGGARARSTLATRLGPAVAQTYFAADISRMSREYDAFIRRLVLPGARNHITQGVSPFADTR